MNVVKMAVVFNKAGVVSLKEYCAFLAKYDLVSCVSYRVLNSGVIPSRTVIRQSK